MRELESVVRDPFPRENRNAQRAGRTKKSPAHGRALLASPTGFEPARNSTKQREDALSAGNVIPLTPVRERPDTAAVEKLSTAIARALRAGNLERARALSEQLRDAMAALEGEES